MFSSTIQALARFTLRKFGLVCPPGIVNVLRAPRDRDASPRKYHKCSKCRARMPLAVDAAAKHLTLWNRAGVHRVAYSTT